MAWFDLKWRSQVMLRKLIFSAVVTLSLSSRQNVMSLINRRTLCQLNVELGLQCKPSAT